MNSENMQLSGALDEASRKLLCSAAAAVQRKNLRVKEG